MQAIVDGRLIDVLVHDDGLYITFEINGKQYRFQVSVEERALDGSIPVPLLYYLVGQAVKARDEEREQSA